MRTAPKIALSLLLTILLFSGLAVAAYTGLFNILETRFYQSAVIGSMEKQLALTADALKAWHTQNNEKFARFIATDPVKRSLLPNQSQQDIFDRLNLAGTLMGDMSELAGIRIIDAGDSTIAPEDDKGTRRIHFSTFKEDILKKEDLQIAYENYGTRSGDLPFKTFSLGDGSEPKLLIEPGKDLFLYCFPFYDAYSTWRGTAVFYVSARGATQYLVKQNLFRISDSLALLSNAENTVSGTVTGMPRVGQALLGDTVIERWANRNFSTDRIVSTEAGGWVLLSSETGAFGYTGQLVSETLFTFPRSVKLLFLAITFLTLYLVIFLLFNLKQDDMMVVRNRIRKFHVQLLNELIDKNEEVRWEEIRKNLSYRKHDISSEIKKSFGNRLVKKHGTEIDSLLGKSWDEILSALGQQETKQSELSNTDEIRKMLEQVLQNNALTNRTAPSPQSAAGGPAAPKQGAQGAPEQTPLKQISAALIPDDDVEEMEEMDELEELDELGEEPLVPAETALPSESAEIEEAETIDEIEDIEELEELEELAEEIETETESDEIEELDEIDELEETPAEIEELAEEIPQETAGEQVEFEELTEATEEEKAAQIIPELPEGELEEIEELEEPENLIEEAEAEIETAPPVRAEPEEDLDELEEDLEELDELDEQEELDELDELETDDGEISNHEQAKEPDSVLVFNFEERPPLDTGPRDRIFNVESDPNSTIQIAGLDFTDLDSALDSAQDNFMDASEEAAEVEYFTTFTFTQPTELHNEWFAEGPVFEYLEVVGEENPEELLDYADYPLPEDGAITDKDGLFIVSAHPLSGTEKTIDPEFQRLVDSVLH